MPHSDFLLTCRSSVSSVSPASLSSLAPKVLESAKSPISSNSKSSLAASFRSHRLLTNVRTKIFFCCSAEFFFSKTFFSSDFLKTLFRRLINPSTISKQTIKINFSRPGYFFCRPVLTIDAQLKNRI